MDQVLQFLQAHGLWIAVGGGLLFLMSRRGGMGCCGTSGQTDNSFASGATSTSCSQTSENKPGVDRPDYSWTTVELQAQLVELQSQQENLARQIARIEVKSAETNTADGDAVGSLPGSQAKAIEREH